MMLRAATIVLLTSLALPFAGQTRRPTQPPTPLPTPTPYAPKVEERYDKFEDRSFVHLAFPIPTHDDPALELILVEESEGVKYVTGPWAYFTFKSLIGSLRSDETEQVYLLLDGSERHAFDAEMDKDGTRTMRVSRQLLNRMATAKKIEGKIGSMLFELTPEEIRALQDFAARGKD